MGEFTLLLGKKGVVILFGIIIFFLSYKNSIRIFDFIEKQTLGTRDYLLEKFELLFWNVDSEKLTWALLSISVGSGVLALICFMLFGKFYLGLFVGFIFFFIGWKLPKPLISFFINKRIKEFQIQMVDGLTLLSNGLRAGLSVSQSLGMVVDELPDPMAQEFNLILQQNKIGVTLDECFENLAKRIPTEDNQMFATSINILRETGGNLAETFDTIAEVIRERVRLKQKIDTYVAQGMVQGITVFSMPFAIMVLYTLSDPAAMKPVFTTPLGLVLLLIGFSLNLLGGFFILKIVRIKI